MQQAPSGELPGGDAREVFGCQRAESQAHKLPGGGERVAIESEQNGDGARERDRQRQADR
jgi:hypothetical protein